MPGDPGNKFATFMHSQCVNYNPTYTFIGQKGLTGIVGERGTPGFDGIQGKTGISGDPGTSGFAGKRRLSHKSLTCQSIIMFHLY